MMFEATLALVVVGSASSFDERTIGGCTFGLLHMLHHPQSGSHFEARDIG